MKKIFVLILMAALLIPFSSAAAKEIQLPDYTLEGAKCLVFHWEWNYETSMWTRIPTETSKRGRPVMTWEDYYIDTNDDGRTDLVIFNFYKPQRKIKQANGEDAIQPAHNKRVVFVDDNFDGDFDRIVFDYYDKNGFPGMDGVYEREIPYGA